MIIQTRPYASLRLDPNNPRIYSGVSPDEIEELALDIAANGLRYPLQINARNEVSEGGRRFRAIGALIAWATPGTVIPDMPDMVLDQVDRRAAELADAVPVLIGDWPIAKVAARAVADNLHRAELSSYEIAQALARLQTDHELTQSAIAAEIGKSTTFVSRHLKTWERATPELKSLWLAGDMAFETVRQLAEKSPAEQRDAIARGQPKGSHGRPGVDQIKKLLTRVRTGMPVNDDYTNGIVAALRVATGEIPITEIEQYIEERDDRSGKAR